MKRKLEYAFILYDADGSGFLDSDELKTVMVGMLDLLGDAFFNFKYTTRNSIKEQYEIDRG